MEINTVKTHWTNERIIDMVRQIRNDLIKDFLDERHLKDYVSSQLGVRELSNVKIEFIKRDLKELLISPVNINHYESLITHIRQTDSAALADNNEKLFYKELEMVIKRYLF